MYSSTTDLWDVIICWRDVHSLIKLRPICKKLCFWSHDSSPLEAPLLVKAQDHIQIDIIFFLSEFHQQKWESFAKTKFRNVIITSNGLSLRQFPLLHLTTTKKEAYRFIYASNYSQGLLHVLQIWRFIWIRYPLASLHIFFGWGVFPCPQRTEIETYLAKYKSENKNVFEYGKVSHSRLADEFMRSEYWIYPATVQESSCITGMKAQAAGCIPIVIQSGALQENIINGYCCTEPKEFISQCLKACSERGSAKQESMRSQLQIESHNKWSWEKIANQWNVLFT